MYMQNMYLMGDNLGSPPVISLQPKCTQQNLPCCFPRPKTLAFVKINSEGRAFYEREASSQLHFKMPHLKGLCKSKNMSAKISLTHQIILYILEDHISCLFDSSARLQHIFVDT